MPWTKLKNIILAILAVTNLSLLLLVGGQALQSGRQASQAREDAIRFLRSRGVEVEDRTIPQTMAWINAGVLDPMDFISHTFSFDHILDAFALVERREPTTRKIVITF